MKEKVYGEVRGLHVPEYLRVKQMMRKGKGMEEKIKKRIIENVVSDFTAKNIHIYIYTNLYFLTTKRWFE